jgi:phosphoglycerate dehydrogenase-like enzyme
VNHLISHPLFTQTDIPITTSSGIHGPTISEWVLMSTLVLSKSYKTMYELQKEHRWGKPDQDFPQPADWVGKKVGIAGYGSIGRQGECCKIYHPFSPLILTTSLLQTTQKPE